MGFMVPIAEKMTMYEVETNAGTFNVPADVITSSECDSRGRPTRAGILKYTEGSKVHSIRKRRGWYAHLSAPGYMDQTEWEGPYKSRAAALAAVKDTYEVDDEGDDLDDEEE